MKVKLIKDHEGFGAAGEEVDVNRVRGLAWIEEGIAEDPRKEKAENPTAVSEATQEKNAQAGPARKTK